VFYSLALPLWQFDIERVYFVWQSSLSGCEPEAVAEMRTRGKVDFRVYWSYFAATGNCGIILLVFGVCVLEQFVISGGDYWMSYWQVQIPGRKLSAI
jgi:hypothetical protein